MKPPKRPHILLLMTDEHRADHTPMEGHPYVRMPRLEEIAEHGVYFRNAYTPSPICVPGRQAILAGQYSRHCGCRHFGEDLAPDVITYPGWFANHGYYTCAAGKMHLQGPDQMKGWNRRIGFDQTSPSLGLPGFEKPDTSGMHQPTPGTGKWPWEMEVKNARYGEGYWNRHDRYAVEGAEMFLDQYFAAPDYDRPDQRPLMLQVSLLMPHFPFICREEWFNYYLNRVEPFLEGPADDHPCQLQQDLKVGEDVSEREVQRATAAYCGMISEADALLGRIIDKLKQLGVYEDFIIVFHTDHGEMLGEHGAWQKFVFYEGAVRSPLMVSCPGKKWEKRTVQQNVNLVDIFPTLCDLAGIPRPEELDGSSLAPLVTGDAREDPDAETFSELYAYATPTAGKRHGWGRGRQLMIKRGQMKFCTYEMADWPDQLFDLGSDPGERRNLATESVYAAVVQEFRRRADAFWAEERRPAFPVHSGKWSFDPH